MNNIFAIRSNHFINCFDFPTNYTQTIKEIIKECKLNAKKKSGSGLIIFFHSN